jgi:hypothetical protein
VLVESECDSQFDGNVSFLVNNENQQRLQVFANQEKKRQAAEHDACLPSHMSQSQAGSLPGASPCSLPVDVIILRTAGLSYGLFITAPHPHFGLSASTNRDDSVMINSAPQFGLTQCHLWPMRIALPPSFRGSHPFSHRFSFPLTPIRFISNRRKQQWNSSAMNGDSLSCKTGKVLQHGSNWYQEMSCGTKRALVHQVKRHRCRIAARDSALEDHRSLKYQFAVGCLTRYLEIGRKDNHVDTPLLEF